MTWSEHYLLVFIKRKFLKNPQLPTVIPRTSGDLLKCNYIVREKNTEYSCTWIYLNIFLSIIYLIWCIWFTWCKSFTLYPPSYVSTLQFWMSGSRFQKVASSLPFVYSWNLPLWDDPGLDVRYLWIFQVDHTF